MIVTFSYVNYAQLNFLHFTKFHLLTIFVFLVQYVPLSVVFVH
jgi:hypothetical protein